MRILIKVSVGIIGLLLCIGIISRAGQNETARKQPSQPQRDYPVKPVPFTAVHLNDSFWAPRIEINLLEIKRAGFDTTSVPDLETTGRSLAATAELSVSPPLGR